MINLLPNYVIESTKILAIGGTQQYYENERVDYYSYDYEDVYYHIPLNTVEQVLLPDDNGVKCSPAPRFPIVIRGGTGAFLDGVLTVCGGITDDAVPEYTNRCFELSSGSDDWREVAGLPTGDNAFLKSSVVAGKWLLSGGVRAPSSTLIYEDGLFTPGPELPFPKDGHCQVTINSTHVFFAGGASEETFMLDVPNGQWIYLSDIPAEVSLGACGLLHHPTDGDGNRLIDRLID